MPKTDGKSKDRPKETDPFDKSKEPLLKRLVKLPPKSILKLRDPMKTKPFIVVKGEFLGVKCTFKVPLENLETVLEKIAAKDGKHLSPGDNLGSALPYC